MIKCNNCGAGRSCHTINKGFRATNRGDRRKARMGDTQTQITG